jgi:HPt (histidine-containing phosphotransfer) domain-containing protein
MVDISAKATDRCNVAARVDAPPIVPGAHAIDLTHLARMTFGERSLEREVLALFGRQAGMLLARMHGEPAKVVGALAHTLGGSARGIGAWQVAAAAEAVERLAANPGDVALAGAVNRVAAAIADAQAAIADLLRAS